MFKTTEKTHDEGRTLTKKWFLDEEEVAETREIQVDFSEEYMDWAMELDMPWGDYQDLTSTLYHEFPLEEWEERYGEKVKYIQKIFIKEEKRNQQIGTKILEEIIKQAKEDGYGSILLIAEPILSIKDKKTEEAIRELKEKLVKFYQDHKFNEVETHGHHLFLERMLK